MVCVQMLKCRGGQEEKEDANDDIMDDNDADTDD